MTRALAACAVCVAVSFGGCGGAQAKRNRDTKGAISRGTASWYGGKFQGRKTASGERFDRRKLTAAHRTLPFGSRVRVTNLKNGKHVVVRINDRGPWGKRGGIIDVSEAAARKLGMTGSGLTRVEIEVLELGKRKSRARRRR